MRLPLRFQPRKAKAAIAKIYSWQPRRIVLGHGRCFDEDVDESHPKHIWKTAFLATVRMSNSATRQFSVHVGLRADNGELSLAEPEHQMLLTSRCWWIGRSDLSRNVNAPGDVSA